MIKLNIINYPYNFLLTNGKSYYYNLNKIIYIKDYVTLLSIFD